MIKGHPFLTGCYKSTCPENSINQANHYYLFVRGLDKDCPKASDVFLCFHILQHVLKRLEMAISPADKALHSGGVSIPQPMLIKIPILSLQARCVGFVYKSHQNKT